MVKTNQKINTCFSLYYSAKATIGKAYQMKSLNNNAPVQCSKSITIHADREKVWSVLTNINRWANWQTDITKPKLNGDVQAGSSFDWTTGGVSIHSVLHTVEPYKEFGWAGKTWGMYAIHNWLITEAENKTIVTVQESMEGFLAKLFRKSFNKSLEKGMEKWLSLLKAECEK